MNNIGKVEILFSEDIKLNDKLKENFTLKINNGIKSVQQSTWATETQIPIEIFAIRGEVPFENDVDASEESLVRSWQLTDLREDRIIIQVDFKNPLLISAGDYPDILFIQLALEDLTTVSGSKFHPCVIKTIEIPQ